MRRAVLTLALCLMLSPAVTNSGVMAAAPNIRQQAIDAYNKADYQRCTTLLEAACLASLANDPTAHYYLANALVKLHRVKEAKAHYETAVNLAPNTALSKYAIAGLANLGGSARGPASAAGAKPVSEEVKETAQANEDKKQQEEEALYPMTIPKDFNPANVDKTLIEIKRPTADTNFALSQVDRALKIVPKGLRDELREFGIKVMITPGMLEADPELATEVPRGYVHGGGYTNCPAMYRGNLKQILISERYSWKSSVPRLNPQICASMLHEMGHAFDHCRNNISQRATYMNIYAEDLGHLSNTQKNTFPYYTQGDGAGETELFAELFSFAADPRLLSIAYNNDLAKAFPKTFKYITNVIK